MAPGPKDDQDDKPSVRQLLHAATGDRAAEGEALADRAEGDVSEDEAEQAVRLAHGDVRGDVTGQPSPERDVASPDDADAVREADEEAD